MAKLTANYRGLAAKNIYAIPKKKITQRRKNKRKPKKESKDDYLFIISGEFLRSPKWRALRYKALVAHGKKCQCCGRTPKDGATMNVDHIKPRATHPQLALRLDNLQILCDWCNEGKGNWDSTDHRW